MFHNKQIILEYKSICPQIGKSERYREGHEESTEV